MKTETDILIEISELEHWLTLILKEKENLDWDNNKSRILTLKAKIEVLKWALEK